ncbi:hypothetical protein V6x_08920 [Gimesia chilikensis]|uniref:DUF3352 domain-containing protein n=1 Tax=Gimesia chilikensis TaxID=2605989 RepID=A0A517W7J4_9PLAN|nr:hypothetical protein [Gimesia chilikensis]QDU01213.1 hypothetical protein V6x_08920 [Gimesia chilikensis]
MRKLIPLFTLLLIGTLPLLSGCGSSTQQAGPPEGPAESMQYLMQGVADQKMEVVWEFLPASYQSDVNGLAHQFADKMDPEIYNEMFAIAQRVAKLLQDKKEYILKNKMLESPKTSPEEVAKYYDPGVDILATLANSDLSTIEKLKTFDGGKFLSTSGSQIAKDFATISGLMPQKEGDPGFTEKLKQAKVTLVSAEGDQATIKIEVPGETTKEEVMVKVEDKWIPQTLAKNWKSKIESAQQSLDKLKPEDITSKKDQAMAGFKQLNATLAQLENAKTEKEFNEQFTNQVRPLAQMAPMLLMLGAAAVMEQGFSDAAAARGGVMADSPGEAKPINPNTMISIVVNKKLTPGEQDPIIDEILQSANDTESLQVIPTVDGEITTFKVYPVEDIEAFSKKIKFGKPSKVDTDSRSITVELE